MNFFHTELAAFILDKVIRFSPAEFGSIVGEKLHFAEGKTIGEIIHLTEKDYQFLSALLFENESRHEMRLEYRGIGMIRDPDGHDFSLKVYCEDRLYRKLEDKLKYVSLKFDSIFGESPKIVPARIANLSFAANSSLSGAMDICSPSGKLNGKLGVWLNRKNFPNSPIGITNNHIAVEFNQFPIGTEIRSSNQKVVGYVEGFVTLCKETSVISNKNNMIDIAWLKPSKSNVNIHLGCAPLQPNGEFDLDDLIKKGNSDIFLCKAKNKKHPGKLLEKMKYLHILDGRDLYPFEDVYKISIGKRGDSGSILLDPLLRIGGIFFATALVPEGQVGFVNKWQYAKSESNIDFDF